MDFAHCALGVDVASSWSWFTASGFVRRAASNEDVLVHDLISVEVFCLTSSAISQGKVGI